MTASRLASLPLCAALLAASMPAARALQAGAPAPAAPDLAAAAAAGPVSTAAYGARCIGAAHDDTAAFQAAIDTGHTVYAPALGGRCHLTAPLVMKTPGQIFQGDGRARTRIVIEPGFAGQGVFVAQTGEPGPVWRDFSVSFVQPDTDDRAKLTRYPPAFYAQSTPRFEMDHLGCYVATACIDMKGNSGGATIADLQMSAFEVGIDIDGSLDTVRVTDPHWYPFQLSKLQQTLFYDQGQRRAIGLRLGRVDDLVLYGGVFLGGIALEGTLSSGPSLSGSISNTDFDSGAGILMRGGTLQITASEFVLGLPGAQGIVQEGGDLVVSSCLFAGSKQNDKLIEIKDGSLSVSSSEFNTSENDVTSLAQTGTNSYLAITGSQFVRAAGIDFRKPTVVLQGGHSLLTSNHATAKGSGEGVFVDVKNDNAANRIIGNASPGWSYLVPQTRKGIYVYN